MKIPLADVCQVLRLPPPEKPFMVTGWSTDSRTLSKGDLFFALAGPNHDGHNHVAGAFRAGAVAAVVERSGGYGLELQTPSVLKALQDLALWARRRFSGKVIGITGSAGKTTTKDVIAHLLSARYRVAKTTGNLNNHIGLPISILRAADDAEVLALEMGMNHEGEIRALAGIARHDIAVVTNVGFAHIENFKSIEGVALAKRELVETLPPGGTAVLNADDPRVADFRNVMANRAVFFGIAEGADFRATEVCIEDSGVRFLLNGEHRIASPLPGRHGVSNLLAGFATGALLGIPEAVMVEQAATAKAPKMRGEISEWQGITILDDSYNANPDAVKVMLETLESHSGRRKIAVLGEMLELGEWSEKLHKEIGRLAAASGVAYLVGIKGVAKAMVDEAVRCGMNAGTARFFESPQEAGNYLAAVAREGDVVLFKGSRGTRVELALEAFRGGS